ncbi:MAG TPA: YggS family pyridoxal phosphate-dependent enzyme [Candidatus Micrarchaeaceae archaeon]|nr:YggS family pyridoxal phosphate-dependent enzyme [Candidatus Micrarchaeaceae archaeon]
MADRLAALLAEVRQLELQSGRAEGSVTLLPVTKGHPPEVAQLAVGLGLTTLGENYLQECLIKDRRLQEAGEARVRWYLLGHLQRNKARRAAATFQVVESVDSLTVARLLSQARINQPRLRVLCEVELTGLPNRTGFGSDALREDFPELLELEGIEVEGLMTVGDPDDPRRSFIACRELLEQLRRASGRQLPTLSMGMSNDFRLGIAEGSTELRIGSLLFGARANASVRD